MTQLATLQADLSALLTAIANAGTLDGASYSAISPIIYAAEQFSTDLATAISTIDAQIVGGMAAGTDPSILQTYLANLNTLAMQEAALITSKNFIDRMVVNLNNSAG